MKKQNKDFVIFISVLKPFQPQFLVEFSGFYFQFVTLVIKVLKRVFLKKIWQSPRKLSGGLLKNIWDINIAEFEDEILKNQAQGLKTC